MSTSRSFTVDRPELPATEGGRYRSQRLIGRGGMGTVHAVIDMVSGERLALKRMRAVRAAAREPAVARFQREYELLAELSHPSIIRVHDFGFDAEGPYYTMELLDSVSLAERGKLSWREACRLLRDVASSLAVLHARRLVHRDVTLRNILRSENGRCKLLDFGAVSSTGLPATVVGTPPYLPPEALGDGPLDVRADLFALGASLYRLLTDRHAYPAARIADLRRHWSTRPPMAHELVADVPLPLSELTAALLSLDPRARPHSAAEIMDRLSALAGVDLHEPHAVRRAYWATPALVGRRRALQQVSAVLASTAERRGGALLISGPTGTGRTRMLEACARHARVAGATVLHVRATDPQARFGVLRALLQSAFSQLPDAHREPSAQRLSQLLAQPRGAGYEAIAAAAVDARRQLPSALCAWAGELAAQRTVLIAVDDVDCADEPSVAALAALCDELDGRSLSIALSAASDRSAHARAALAWLGRIATRVELSNLTRAQVLELLSSVFGDVPNIAVLADRVHALSDGHPQWVMQLCEHLVESGAVRYEAGAFSVPLRLAVDELPSTLHAAMHARLSSLGEQASELACAFMHASGSWFAPDEIAAVWELPLAQVKELLAELIDAGVLARDRGRAGLKLRAFASALSSDGEAAVTTRAHTRLARMFERREDAARAARHLWAAGEREAAVRALIAYSEAIDLGMRSDAAVLDRAIATVPADFIALLCDAIDACVALGMPRRSELMLRLLCARMGSLTSDGREIPHLRALGAELRIETGLADYEQLAAVADPGQRLTQAQAQAQARHDAAGERERGFPVSDAIRLLAATRGYAAGTFSLARDFSLQAAMPSLAPLLPLSTELAVVQLLSDAVDHVMARRNQRATGTYQRVIDELDKAAGKVSVASQRFNRFGSCYPLGMIAAERGQAAALEWADKLESVLLYEVLAWRIRMQYHRVRGDLEESERCRRKAELLRIANRPFEHYGTNALASDLGYYVAVEDLIGIKHTIEEIARVVPRFPGWKPVLLHARGYYRLLRGEPAAALERFEAALAGCVPVHDGFWVAPAAACLSALLALGQLDQARRLGRSWLRTAQDTEMEDAAIGLAQRLALAEAALGDRAPAIEHAEWALGWIERLHISGLHAALAHETRARVALALGDAPAFQRHLELCRAQLKIGRGSRLWARFERLQRDARAAGMDGGAQPPARAREPQRFDAVQLRAHLNRCSGSEQRSAGVLEFLLCATGAWGGTLYLARGHEMRLEAAAGQSLLRSELDDRVRVLREDLETAVQAQHADSACTATGTLDASLAFFEGEARSFLLMHEADGRQALVGVALLRVADDAFPDEELLRTSARLLLEYGDATPTALG